MGTASCSTTRPDDTIGGADVGARNLISGNGGHGIFVVASQGTLIEGNLFGTNRTLSAPLLNDGYAVFFNAYDEAPALIQVDAAPTSHGTASDVNSLNKNTAGYLSGQLTVGKRGCLYGYQQYKPERVAQVELGENVTKIFNDATPVPPPTTPSLEFDLGAPGVQPNDGDNPLTPAIDPDSDDGPNGLQNYPVLTSAMSGPTGATITGGLNTLTNTSFRLEFYSSSISPDLFRGGEQYLGFVDVTTDTSGNASFTFASPIVVPNGQFILSTATLLVKASDGTEVPTATSEFSDGIEVGAVPSQPTANLSVSQSATPNPAAAGGNLTFTLTVANAGPDPATGVHLVVTPPAGATFVSATGGVMPVGGTLTFNLGSSATDLHRA